MYDFNCIHNTLLSIYDNCEGSITLLNQHPAMCFNQCIRILKYHQSCCRLMASLAFIISKICGYFVEHTFSYQARRIFKATKKYIFLMGIANY